MAGEHISLTYRLAMAVVWPVIRWWGRLEVVGLELVPPTGPVIVMVNHDSAWDPFIVGVAAVGKRQVRALAKSSLWDVRPVGWVLEVWSMFARYHMDAAF